MDINFSIGTLAIIYCSLALVGWIPYVLSYQDIIYIRYFLFLLLSTIFLTEIIKKPKYFFEKMLWILVFFSLYLLLNFSGLINGEKREVFVHFRDLIYLSLIFISATYFTKENLDVVLKVFIYIFGFFSAIHILSSYNLLIITHPTEGKNISTTGLSDFSTVWSSRLACISLLYFLINKKSNLDLVCFILIFSSQIIVNGRSGILATTIGIVIFSIFEKNYKYLILIGVILIAPLIRPTENLNRYQDHIFYDQRVVKNYNTGYIYNNKEISKNLKSIGCTNFCLEIIEKLDIISSYRIQQWLLGISIFLKNPMGTGFGNSPVWVSGANREFDIHNVFIRMSAEGGLFSLIFCLFILLIPIILFPIKYRIYFLISTIPAFFEPRFIFNAGVDYSSIWWLMYFIIFKSWWDTYKSQKRLSI